MANNYTQFSEFLPYKTQEQREWLNTKLEDSHESDEGPPCDFQDEPDFNRVWIYTEESGNVETLAELVAEFQTHFGIKEPWSLEWANTCSKPRIGEFSGGGLLVMNGEIDYFVPCQQIEERKRAKGWFI